METLLLWLPTAQVFEPAMPSVPDAPFLERWVTGTGYAGAGLLAAVGVVAYLVLSRTARARLALPTLIGLWLLGGVVLLIGAMVQTPREALRASARDLVAAAVEGDKARLGELLHENARVRARYASAEGRDRILPLVGRVEYRIRSHSVRRVQVDLRGPRVARTHLRLSVTSDTLPPASIWTVDWQRATDDAPWVVTLIEPYWIQGMTDPAGP
jgi:hypothetical protein